MAQLLRLFPAAFPRWGTSPRTQILRSLPPTWATAPGAEPLLLIQAPVLSPVPAPKFGLCLCSPHSGKKAQHAPGVGSGRAWTCCGRGLRSGEGGLGRSGRSTPGLDFAAASCGSGASGMVGSLAPKEGGGGGSAEGSVGRLGTAVPESFRVPSGPDFFRARLSYSRESSGGGGLILGTTQFTCKMQPLQNTLGPGELQKPSSEKHLSPFVRAAEQPRRERPSATRRIFDSTRRDGGWREHVFWRFPSPPGYLPHSTSRLPRRRARKFTSSFEPICKNIAL